MKKIICLVVLISLLVACQEKPFVKTVVEGPQSDFTVYKEDINRLITKYKTQLKLVTVVSSFNLYVTNDIEVVFNIINYDNVAYYNLSCFTDFNKKKELPKEVDVDMFVDLINSVALTPVNKEEIMEFILAPDAKYQAESDEDDDYITAADLLSYKTKGEIEDKENLFGMLIYKDYSGMFEIYGHMKEQGADVDFPKILKTPVEKWASSLSEWSYSYGESYEAELSANLSLEVEIYSEISGDIIIKPYDFQFYVCLHTTIENDSQLQKYLDTKLLANIISILSVNDFQVAVIDDLLKDDSGKYDNPDDGYGVSGKINTAIPGFEGSLQYDAWGVEETLAFYNFIFQEEDDEFDFDFDGFEFDDSVFDDSDFDIGFE